MVCYGIALGVLLLRSVVALQIATDEEADVDRVFPIALDLGPWELKLDVDEDNPNRECHTDSDCDISADRHFRCMRVKDLEQTPGNKCRIAGMSQKDGDKACMCSTMTCSKGPGPPADESKIQYLMIGDCIMYTARVRIEKFLESQGWEIAPTIGNAGSTNRAAHCMDSWLQNYPPVDRKWDVISFNFGLHDVAHTTEHLTVEEYAQQFDKILHALVAEQERSGTTLLWITTTPAPDQPSIDDDNCTTPSGMRCLTPTRRNWDIEAYNAAAAQVIQNYRDLRGAQIEVLDLYSHIVELCGGPGYKFCSEYQKDYNAHFLTKGYDMIAEQYKEKLISLPIYRVAQRMSDDGEELLSQRRSFPEVQEEAPKAPEATGPTAAVDVEDQTRSHPSPSFGNTESNIDCSNFRETTWSTPHGKVARGCAWTKNWNCEGQAPGRMGRAGDDGSKAYECCCKQGRWKYVSQARK